MYERSGMGFTNWRSSPGDPCSEVSNGQQRCFRTTTVDGRPPEQDFAAANGCVSRREVCSTSYGNPGIVWCCPPGWPLQPGSPPLEPGEEPPAASGQGSSLITAAVPALGLAALAAAGYFYWKSRS
jgi:hypothetical protein